MGRIGQIFLRGTLAALTAAWTAAGGTVGLVLLAMTDQWVALWAGLIDVGP